MSAILGRDKIVEEIFDALDIKYKGCFSFVLEINTKDPVTITTKYWLTENNAKAFKNVIDKYQLNSSKVNERK